MSKNTLIDLAELLRVPYVDAYSGYDISPDGKSLTFAWNRSGQWEIYQLSLDRPEVFRQISSGEGAKFGPCYSPDGEHLAYVVDLDGSEQFDIWIYSLKSGAAVNLTPETPFTLQPRLSWSPDGKRLACISDQSGRFRTYLLDVSGSSPDGALSAQLPIFDASGPHLDVQWSPDGRWLAVTAEGKGQDYTTHLIPLTEQASRPAQDAARPSVIAFEGQMIDAREVCWSPDSQRLAFSSNATGNHNIGIYSLADGLISWLTSGGGEKSEPDWSPDGKRIAYILTDGPETWLAVHELGQSHPRVYRVEPGVHFMPRFTPDGKTLIFVFDNPRQPDDLWALHLESETFRRLTNSLPTNLSEADFIMPQHISYPSLDGNQVPALLYLPAGFTAGAGQSQLPPAVIVIHGGPNWLFQFLWYPLMTHLVSRGWVVLAPNYRGSTGYGREWQLANRFDMGRGDVMDVVAGADYLVRMRLADEKRIAVTGRSHGGYLTMCCLTQYPDRFAGGSAIVPFLNWFTSHANSRMDLQHWDIENMGDPQEHEALWRERSPYFYLDRIQAPVQMICGANDPRCPASESLAAEQVLRALGKEVELILYPDEGHTFLKIENVLDHELRRVEFLARLLE
jgi:dipeptidyl aminopeptidase/acylaminoacyl peptidase